jgi:hypothetical protein
VLYPLSYGRVLRRKRLVYCDLLPSVDRRVATEFAEYEPVRAIFLTRGIPLRTIASPAARRVESRRLGVTGTLLLKQGRDGRPIQ